MTTYTWSVNGSGSWSDASDWNDGTDGVPTDLDTAIIDMPGIEVSVGTMVTAAAYILDTTGATLQVDGGHLTTEHMADFNGKFIETAGTYTVGGMGALFSQNLSQTGGVIDVLTGVLTVGDGSTLAGSLTGAGALDFTGGNNYLATGFVCQLGALEVTNGARLGLRANFSYAHNLTVVNATLDLLGYTLVDNGGLTLSGVAGGGTIQDAGTVTLGTNLFVETLDNGLNLAVTGTLLQVNNISLGAADSGAEISIGKTGHYSINGNWNVTDSSSVGTIASYGVIAKTGGGKLSQIDTSVMSSGTLAANIGELQLDGLINTISGTVSGAGTLGIGGAGQTTFATKLALGVANLHQSAGILVLKVAQTYAGDWNMSGGVLNLDAAGAVLTLSGRESFDAGTITGYGGTLMLGGPAELGAVTIGSTDKIDVAGTLTQTGTVLLGQSSNPTVNIAAKASWLIDADSSIIGTYGLINNSGVLWDRNGSNTSTIQSEIVSTGTIIADSTLQLDGDQSLLGGTLSGAGLLDLSGGGTIGLQSGLAIHVASLDIATDVVLAGNQADAGIFSQYTGTLDLSGQTFALSGTTSLDGGMLIDGGTLSASGPVTIAGYDVTGAAELLISGAADQAGGGLTLQDTNGSGTLCVAAGASYNVLNDSSINGTGTAVIAGKLTDSGTGIASIAASVTLQSSGVLTANNRMLSLTDGGTLSGTLAGTGNADLAGGTFLLATGLSVTAATFEVSSGATAQLSASLSYGGDFITTGATLAFSGDTLSLGGTATLGNASVLSGAGTLAASASATLAAVTVEGTTTLLIAGAAQQLGLVTVGNPSGTASTARLSITGTDTLGANASIQGDGTLSVASGGSLIAGSDAFSQLATTTIDQGVIAANQGELQVTGTVTAASSGIFAIGAAGLLDFSSTSVVGSATGVSFAGAGTLRVEDLHGFAATIENFATKDMIQIVGVSGASVTGTYANAAHTQLLVADSSGDSIVLSFSTAQTLSAITFGAGAGGIATLTHH